MESHAGRDAGTGSLYGCQAQPGSAWNLSSGIFPAIGPSFHLDLSPAEPEGTLPLPGSRALTGPNKPAQLRLFPRRHHPTQASYDCCGSSHPAGSIDRQRRSGIGPWRRTRRGPVGWFGLADKRGIPMGLSAVEPDAAAIVGRDTPPWTAARPSRPQQNLKEHARRFGDRNACPRPDTALTAPSTSRPCTSPGRHWSARPRRGRLADRAIGNLQVVDRHAPRRQQGLYNCRLDIDEFVFIGTIGGRNRWPPFRPYWAWGLAAAHALLRRIRNTSTAPCAPVDRNISPRLAERQRPRISKARLARPQAPRMCALRRLRSRLRRV